MCAAAGTQSPLCSLGPSRPSITPAAEHQITGPVSATCMLREGQWRQERRKERKEVCSCKIPDLGCIYGGDVVGDDGGSPLYMGQCLPRRNSNPRANGALEPH